MDDEFNGEYLPLCAKVSEIFLNRETIHAANDYLSPVNYQIQNKTM